jgi:hypothetical protein
MMVDDKTVNDVLSAQQQRLSSGNACLSDFAQEWGKQEGASAGNYLVSIGRGDWLAKELQHAVRSGVLKVFDTVRNRERDFRPETDAEGVDKGYVRLSAQSVNAWLAGEGLAQIEGEGLPVSPSATTQPAPVPEAVAPAADESQEVRQARRFQMCINAGLEMPDNDYASLPRGIGALAKREGIKRQSFTEDVKAHIRRLNGR